MHLTPEQIDRQPFRMTRRGYDIVEVRDFLREVATEMRERRDVRSRLAGNGETTDQDSQEGIESAESRAAAIVAAAEKEAERRIGSAEAVLERAAERAETIRAEAQREADGLIEGAEERAVERSSVVLAEAQQRLDEMLREEQEFLDDIEAKSEVSSDRLVAAGVAASSAQSMAPPTSTLADLMKSTVRQELHSK